LYLTLLDPSAPCELRYTGDVTRRSILLIALAGCAPQSEAVDASDESGLDDAAETDDDAGDAYPCETVADPATYTDGPIVSPEPWVGTVECPALGEDPLVIDLPSPAVVTGELQLEGLPTTAAIKFVGHDGLGQVNAFAEDGTFAAELLPGVYDISAMTPGPELDQWVVVQSNVELTTDTMLVLAVPPSVLVSGTMLMDGAPVPDEFGYIEVIANTGDRLALAMADSDYALTLSPGEYQFVYSWCDRSAPVPIHATSICADPDAPPIPADAPRIGPEQQRAPFLEVVVGEDTLLELDVPTAMVSGIITLDGVGPDAAVIFRVDDEFGFARLEIADDGSFAGRIVQGEYAEARVYAGEVIPELEVIVDDVEIEIHRESVSISAAELDVDGLVDPWNSWKLELVRLDTGHSEDFAWLTVEGEPVARVWPGLWSAIFHGAACWPGLDEPEFSVIGKRGLSVVAEPQLDLQAPTQLEIEFELAALAVDLRELGTYVVPEYDQSNNRLLHLQLFPEGSWTEADVLQGRDLFIGDPQELALQGYGRSLLGTVDVVDGTTLVLRPNSREFDAEWTIGGVPVGSAGDTKHLFMRNLDTGHLRIYQDPIEDGPNTLPPGQYELIYVGFDEYGDGFPDNTDPRVGCVTVEG
jgi:hypothetical protein